MFKELNDNHSLFCRKGNYLQSLLLKFNKQNLTLQRKQCRDFSDVRVSTYVWLGMLKYLQGKSQVPFGRRYQVLLQQLLRRARGLLLTAVEERDHPLVGACHVFVLGTLKMQ